MRPPGRLIYLRSRVTLTFDPLNLNYMPLSRRPLAPIDIEIGSVVLVCHFHVHNFRKQITNERTF